MAGLGHVFNADDQPIPSALTRKDLSMALSLLPAAHVDLTLTVYALVVATDASLSGGAVVYSRWDRLKVLHVLTAWGHYTRHPSGENMQEYLRVVHNAVERTKWTKAFNWPWATEEHISNLEARAATKGIEWLASGNVSGMLALLLLDSLSLVMAFKKGRSSSFRFAPSCRRAAALATANHFRVEPAFIDSKWNPADPPSREFSNKGPSNRN